MGAEHGQAVLGSAPAESRAFSRQSGVYSAGRYQLRAVPNGGGAQHGESRPLYKRANERARGVLHGPGFFHGYFAQRTPQHLAVFQRHAGIEQLRRGQRANRVTGAAYAGLKHGEIRFLTAEEYSRQQREPFEMGKREFTENRPEVLIKPPELRAAYHFPVEDYALAQVGKVRRSVQAAFKAVRAQEPRQEESGGTLAVGAYHLRARVRQMRVTGAPQRGGHGVAQEPPGRRHLRHGRKFLQRLEIKTVFCGGHVIRLQSPRPPSPK